MIRLLDSCIRILAAQGMRKLFVDAIKGGDQGFQELGEQAFSCPRQHLRWEPFPANVHPNLGFQKWAAYREVWRNTWR